MVSYWELSQAFQTQVKFIAFTVFEVLKKKKVCVIVQHIPSTFT